MATQGSDVVKTIRQMIALAALCCWSTCVFCASLTTVDLKNLPGPAIEARLAAEPYVSDYLYAARLLSEDKKDDAVFWYYVGQLRGRVYYTAHPSDQDGIETFSSVTQVLGESINAYAGSDPAKWAAIINKVLAWDASHDDPQSPKGQFESQRQQVRAGLSQLRDSILQKTANKANE